MVGKTAKGRMKKLDQSSKEESEWDVEKNHSEDAFGKKKKGTQHKEIGFDALVSQWFRSWLL